MNNHGIVFYAFFFICVFAAQRTVGSFGLASGTYGRVTGPELTNFLPVSQSGIRISDKFIFLIL